MTPPRTVLFDFGGVIAPLAAGDLLAGLENQLELTPGSLHGLMYEGDLWPDVSTGRLTEEEYWRCLAQETGHDPGILRQTLLPVWEPQAIDDDVVNLVRALHARVRLAVLSNATPGLEEQLATFGLDDLFDLVINSCRIGLRKPDPEVFRYALEVLGEPSEAVLFVDDKERNTLVAEELGIPSILFQNAAQLAQEMAARGLSVNYLAG